MNTMQRSQLAIFKDRLPVDKNLGFDTVQSDGKIQFNTDLAANFGEHSADVLDCIVFLSKKQYDEPFFTTRFSLADYAKFYNKHRTYYDFDKGQKEAIRKKSIGVEEEDLPNNKLEVLFNRILATPIIAKKRWNVPSEKYLNQAEHKITQKQPINIISNFYELDKEITPDKRKTFYAAKLGNEIIANLSNYFYYSSLSDSKLVHKSKTKNLRLLYHKILSILNELLRNGTYVFNASFTDLSMVMGYDNNKNARSVKQKLTKHINWCLTELNSLKGVSFTWTANENGHLYVGTFTSINTVKENKLIERTEDKFKRLDMLILTTLSENYEFDINSRPGNILYEDFWTQIKTSEKINLANIFNYAYTVVFKMDKAPKGALKLFLDHLCYFDYKHNKYYVSSIIQHMKTKKLDSDLVLDAQDDIFYKTNKTFFLGATQIATTLDN